MHDYDPKELDKDSLVLPNRDNGNISSEKAKWIALIEEHLHFSNHDFIHPFFGKMTIEQIGYHAYIHTNI